MKNKKRKAVRALLLVVMAACLIPVCQSYIQSARHRAQQDSLKEKVIKAKEQHPSANDSESGGTDGAAGINQNARNMGTKQTGDKILKQYAALYEENEDIAGWLSIEGMKIDYPVMQSEDDEYYLYRDFYRKHSKYGSLYVKGRADLGAGTNFIIYGHNMKDGSMFGDLELYLDKSFYKEHPAISFDTLYEERIYDIIAVFRTQVYDAGDDVFRYYQFYDADTQEEFDDFYDNIKELSLYETGVEAQFGDTFLTLSTCSYHVEDGRFVVVAKRRKTG